MHPARSADAIIEKRGILRPDEIRIDLLAFLEGACVVWGDAGRADARVARSGEEALITLPRAAFGMARARFSIAHELAHHLLHPGDDSIARIHGLPPSDARAFRCEWEANEFARHLLVPTSLAASMCTAAAPPLSRVMELARAFDVSLSVAARRWAELSPAPCAFVEAQAGKVKWATRSSAFRGEAVKGRVLDDGSLALDLTCGWSRGERTRTHRAAWGSARAGSEVVEECVPLGKSGTVLAWLWHE